MNRFSAALCAVIAIFLTACSSGRGIGGTTQAFTVHQTQSGLGPDGEPTRGDNCPGILNPPTVTLLECPGCTTYTQCYTGSPETATQLADGTMIPVATNKSTGASSPVGVWLVDSACVTQADTDLDGIGDACDQDDDGDLISDVVDNCPLVSNQDQLNTDAASDGGNVCDLDDDNDGVPDIDDNCPLVVNADQVNTDGDSMGNACEDDMDGDGVPDIDDNCPLVVNADQVNTDGDSYLSTDPLTGGDACDLDDDGDLDPDVSDCAPLDPSIFVGQFETCNGLDDNCDDDVDESFDNTDGDMWADCVDTDDDNDGVPDIDDNCPLVVNADQVNTDGDSYLSTDPLTGGDACDLDDDNDGVPDIGDNCPLVMNVSQSDTDTDGLGDACDEDCDGDGVPDTAACNLGDLDGDGFEPPEDCLEGDPTVSPNGVEVCNNADDDCDGVTDNGGDTLCQSWEICTPQGCVQNPDIPAPECQNDSDCVDTDMCTSDMCDQANVCLHMPVTCIDNDACTADSCVPATGCVYTPMVCTDNNACTDDVCLGGECSSMPKNCDDANPCTADACTPETGVCTHTMTTCPQGQVCNTTNGACEVPPECVDDAGCNDGNSCTQNRCVSGSCTYPPLSCPQGQFCNPNTGGVCQPLPTVGGFDITFTVTDIVRPEMDECRLLFEGGVSAAQPDSLSLWGIKASVPVVSGQPTVLTWSKTIVGLAYFVVDVVCVDLPNPADQQHVAGRLDFNFFDGATLWNVIKVPRSSYSGSQYFVSDFGSDIDGDGLPNGSDSSPWDGSLPSMPPT